jgi:hypothetical protein
MEAAAREQRWLGEGHGATGWTRPEAPPESRPAPARRPAPAYARPTNYKPIAIRAHILRWWLVAGILVNASVTVLSAIHLSILDSDGFAGSDAVVASDERLAVGGAALLATFAVTTVLWLLWFHRAYRNVDSFGSLDMRMGQAGRWVRGSSRSSTGFCRSRSPTTSGAAPSRSRLGARSGPSPGSRRWCIGGGQRGWSPTSSAT